MAKKRANGEGNIRKRKDGRWEGRYTAGVDPETGKPIAKSVLARTQRECKEKLQKAMEELEKIDITKRRDYTVGEWAQLWYENYAKPSVRASTAAYYKNYIDQHIVPRIGDVKLTALTTLQIQKFYNETKAHGRVQRYGPASAFAYRLGGSFPLLSEWVVPDSTSYYALSGRAPLVLAISVVTSFKMSFSEWM